MAEVVSVVDAEAASVEAVASAVEADASNFETSFFISFITEGGLTVSARPPSFVSNRFLLCLQVLHLVGENLFSAHPVTIIFVGVSAEQLKRAILV